MTGAAPLTIAFVAGGLSTLNPCGFPLLPAFLSFYIGADEERLPRAPNRTIQGLLVGLAITVGYLGVFALAGLPITYGATAIAQALPWLGIAIGIALAIGGSLSLLGGSLSFSVTLPLRLDDRHRLTSMVVFGVAYGLASLGCALPLFLALVGSSLGAEGAGAVVVFLAFSLGTASMLIALSLAAAMAREGLAQHVRLLIPHVSRFAGALLLVAGAYVVYYWARLEFGSKATLASDPIVGFGTRFTAHLQALAAGEGRIVLAAAGSIVALALIAGLWQMARESRRSGIAPSDVRSIGDE